MNQQDTGEPARRHRPATATPHRSVVHDVTGVQPSQRGTLTQKKVLTAAVEIIDSDGVDGFTMRRVAEGLGVEPMALYRYFGSRRELLDGVAEQVAVEMFAGSGAATLTEGWQDFVSRVAHSCRRSALAHPPLFLLIATRETSAPWVRPPLRNLRWMEAFLEIFHRNGFDGAVALAAYHAFASFLLGNLLLEVNLQQGSAGFAAVDLPGYPRLHNLQAELALDNSAEEFQRSLTILISSVDLLRHRRAT